MYRCIARRIARASVATLVACLCLITANATADEAGGEPLGLGTACVGDLDDDGIDGDGIDEGCELHIIVVLDRTGSMDVVREGTGNTRCEDAIDLALIDLAEFFVDGDTAGRASSAAVWTFSGDAPTPLTAFVSYDDASEALEDLDVEGCDGGTPLADASCGAADAITDAFPAYAALLEAGLAEGLLYISIITDGDENTSTGECDGPGSTTAPPPAGDYTPGSWHANVYEKVITEFGLTVLTHFLEDDIPAEAPGAGGNAIDAIFFEDLATSSGGEHTPVCDSDPAFPPVTGGVSCIEGACFSHVEPGTCVTAGGFYLGDDTNCQQPCGSCTGDTNGDGVINVIDLVNVIVAWQTADPAADINDDGIVNVLDLLEIVLAWGDCP